MDILVVPAKNVGMSDKDAAELVKNLHNTTPLFRSDRKERLCGIEAVEQEANNFAPSLREAIFIACSRAKVKEGFEGVHD
jgi:hypothetical protein